VRDLAVMLAAGGDYLGRSRRVRNSRRRSDRTPRARRRYPRRTRPGSRSLPVPDTALARRPCARPCGRTGRGPAWRDRSARCCGAPHPSPPAPGAPRRSGRRARTTSGRSCSPSGSVRASVTVLTRLMLPPGCGLLGFGVSFRRLGDCRQCRQA
jgi:hypothetical protein